MRRVRRSAAGLLWAALGQVLTKQDHMRRATSASVHLWGPGQGGTWPTGPMLPWVSLCAPWKNISSLAFECLSQQGPEEGIGVWDPRVC